MTFDECVDGWAQQLDALAADQIDLNAARLVAAGFAVATVDALTASAWLDYVIWRVETLLQLRASLLDDRPIVH